MPIASAFLAIDKDGLTDAVEAHASLKSPEYEP
jgi:hypothetical protein